MAGFLAAGLGIGLALLALVAGASVQLGWLAGLGLAVVSAALWWFVARRGSWVAVAPPYAPALGMAHIAPVGPLLLAFFMEPPGAAGASALAAVLVMCGSVASGHGAPLTVVDPLVMLEPWAAVARHGRDFAVLVSLPTIAMVGVWAAAGGLGAIVARRGTRIAGVAAVLVAAAILTAGYTAWATLGAFAWRSTDLALQLGLSLLVGLGVAAIAPPPVDATRPEPEGD